MGNFKDFTGIQGLSGFYKHVGNVLLMNELGGTSDGYHLSQAGGNSGYSFGGNQMDLSTNNAEYRNIFKDILVNARNASNQLIFSNGAQFYNNNLSKITSTNPNALSTSERSQIDQALSSTYGRNTINEAFVDEINVRTNEVNARINSLPEGSIKTALQTSAELQLYLVDYHNQFNIEPNGKLMQYLRGEQVNHFSKNKPISIQGDLDVSDLKRFFEGTEQAALKPRDIERRYNNNSHYIEENDIGQFGEGGDVYMTFEPLAQTFSGVFNMDIQDALDPESILIRFDDLGNGLQRIVEVDKAGALVTTIASVNSAGHYTFLEQNKIYDSADATITRTHSQFNSNNQPTDEGALSINFNGINYQGELAGQIFGSQLGALLGDGNVFAEVGLGTLGSAIAGNLSEFIGTVGQSVLAERQNVGISFRSH